MYHYLQYQMLFGGLVKHHMQNHYHQECFLTFQWGNKTFKNQTGNCLMFYCFLKNRTYVSAQIFLLFCLNFLLTIFSMYLACVSAFSRIIPFKTLQNNVIWPSGFWVVVVSNWKLWLVLFAVKMSLGMVQLWPDANISTKKYFVRAANRKWQPNVWEKFFPMKLWENGS